MKKIKRKGFVYMRKRTVFANNNSEIRLLSIEELQQYLSVGRNSAVEIGKVSKAAVSIGRRKLYDRIRIDAYIEEQFAKEYE